MRSSRLRNLVVVVFAALVVVAASASPALADGYCGHDLYETSACPVTTSGSVTGTYEADFTSNWFVFFARRDTRLTLSIADNENPACANITYAGCSHVLATLWESSGFLAQTPGAQPLEGPVPASVSVRLRSAGIYHVQVTGALSTEPAPYTLTVSGSPNVSWPPCTVPRLRRHTSLRTAKRRLLAAACSVGRIVRVQNQRVPRGDVIRLRPGAGTIAAPSKKVAIDVSSG